jgi:NADP-dependent 3-hydroxy acid dehydrogenase YdfG
MNGVLSGKKALVTGASSGIGRGAALALAAAGAQVALVARRAERLKEVAAQIDAGGGHAFARQTDVTDEADASQAVADTIAHFGGLDILVNAAGMTQTGKVENGDLGDWRYVFELNFWSGYYTARAAIPALREGGGDIVNISSTAGRRPVGATFGPYAASKFALTAFTESLRAEVTAAGIRVSIIEPGATATEVHKHIKDERVRESTRQHVEKDGALRPEDVAAAIVFVVSLPRHVNVSQLMVRPSVDPRVI